MRLADKPLTDSERITQLESLIEWQQRRLIDLEQAVTMLCERVTRGESG